MLRSDAPSAAASPPLLPSAATCEAADALLEEKPPGQNFGFTLDAAGGRYTLGAEIRSVVPRGAVAIDGRIRPGDLIVEIDGSSVVGCSHGDGPARRGHA